jgi:hypothetical protein
VFKQKLCGLVVLGMVVIAGAGPGYAQWADQRLDLFDTLQAREEALAKLPHNPLARRGTAGNVAALAARWPSMRPAFARLALEREPAEDWQFDPSAVAAAAAGGSISSVNLADTRLSGFTQNETAAAWCGSSVVVTYNDTGAEVDTFQSSSGVSAIGDSASANKGASYSYNGPPLPPSDPAQEILGDPSLACTSQTAFDYSAIWWDSANVLTGVAFATSTNGGKSFSEPVAAISKDGFTHEIAKDSLAVSSADPSQVYIAYVDQDYSGSVCGTFPIGDPNAGQEIPRYAIELVASSDGGSSWSAPVVIEQVCADDATPNAFVEGPAAAVGNG